MLEIKEYTYNELSQIFGTSDRQGIKRKLRSYDIKYETQGRGERTVYKILEIPNKFKLFCITELQFPAQANFEKMLYYYYYFFNDDTFAGLPNQEQANIFMEQLFNVSRQTIANWVRYLEQANYVYLSNYDCKYYAVTKDKFTGQKLLTEISHEKYSRGWSAYWGIRRERPREESGFAWREAMEIWGGCACKHRLPLQNAFYIDKIEELINIINDIVSDKILNGEIPASLF
ncbi:MAG: hypothetical protein J1E34_03780 [Oscillospiraceae bacterium]|nr:hypothetical protein [Oscillospiraceae bacterium]